MRHNWKKTFYRDDPPKSLNFDVFLTQVPNYLFILTPLNIYAEL